MSSPRPFGFDLALLICALMIGPATASGQTTESEPSTAPVYGVVADVPDNTLANPGGDRISQGRNGDVYATSPPNGGVVFSATTGGILTEVHEPGGGPEGVALGTDGNLYGTGQNNGTGVCGFAGCGIVYKVTPAGVETVLHNFNGTTDGYTPAPTPVEAPNGLFYGVADGSSPDYGTIYSVSASGAFKVLHTFTGSDGKYPHAGLTVGSDGNLYGGTSAGGADNAGVLFRITASGAYTVLHNFCSQTNCADGQDLETPLVLGGDGNLYGMTYRNASYGNTNGVIFRLTNTGVYTALVSPGWTTAGAMTAGTGGKLYGVFAAGGSGNNGQIFSMTTSGVVTILHKFCQETSCTDGYGPSTPLVEHTNGLLYGFTGTGGTPDKCNSGGGCGVFYSLNVGLAPFINLSTYSGSVGATVGIFGQDFDSASVVKFNGVKATKIVLSGTTYITATVPAGATDGKVTVTTGTTTLSSTSNFIVHNTWRKGAAMPTGTVFSSAAVLNGEIYVIGGDNASGTVLSDVQIYTPSTNTWSTGTPLPTATDSTSAVVVNNILYVFGGSPGTGTTNAVWAYNPSTKKWTGKAAMLAARNGTLAVVENGIVYVIGGNLGGGGNFVATVDSYDPATNTWKTEASMDGAKDFPAGGLSGATIVAADGSPAGGVVTGYTEGFDATTDKWTTLAGDPTPRNGTCSGVINGTLYDASGYPNNAGAATTVNESFNLSTNKWTTTLAAIPLGTMYGGSVVSGGQLYCFGGWAVVNQKAISNVQVYQP
jgi:uncharacterized repeat protein (TIGR03803 family)